MARPAATVAGAALILLRVAAGVFWLVQVVLGWAGGADIVLDGQRLSPVAQTIGLAAVVTVVAVYLTVETLLAALILRGWNWPRVLVMVFAVVSISTTFFAWWEQGQQITIQTTLLTLGLDVLILLALSSRTAAAYARRSRR